MLTLEEEINLINQAVPIFKMWDGFWIHDYEKGTLTVSCSFDKLLYRNFDIIFEGVIFYNIPIGWQDENLYQDKLLYSENDFNWHFEDFDTQNKRIYTINLVFKRTLHSFYVVADSVIAEIPLKGNHYPNAYYKDPFADKPFPCYENRVL